MRVEIIKADTQDDVHNDNKLDETAGRIPVLVRDGGKAPDQEILERTETLIQQGDARIVYGHNVIQHQTPAGMTKTIMAVVHDGASAADAARFLR
jgi:DhnA family fructose-bisphosphate aldolase class Ia